MSENWRKQAKNLLHSMRITEVSGVPAGDSPGALVSFVKAAPETDEARNPAPEATAGDLLDMADTPNPADQAAGDATAPDGDEVVLTKADWESVTAYVAHLEDEVRKATDIDDIDDVAKEGKGKPPWLDKDHDHDEDDEDEDMDKSAPLDVILKANPVVAEAFASLQAQADEAHEIAKSALAAAAAERDARMDVEFAKHAKALSALGDEGELAGLLRKAHAKLDADEFGEVEALLAKAARQVEEAGLFTELGSTGAASADSELDQLIAKAASGNGDISKAAALDAYLVEHPDEYDRIVAERYGLNGKG